MKKIKFTSILIIVLLSLGCNEEFLEPKPLSFFSPQNTLNTPEALESILTSCEKSIREIFFTTNGPIITDLIFSEVTVYGKTDSPTPAQNLNLSITPDAQLNNGSYNRIGWWWDQGYESIKNANTVIARIDDPQYGSEEEKNEILGAAYFHRAYWYYHLVHQFGDVPLLLNEINEPRIDFYSTKREVILKKLKSDLEFSQKWLSDNVDKGTVTKGAAGHLLTKVNLALGLFDDAINSANEVINSGQYKLMTERFGINKDDPEKNVLWDLHRPQNKAVFENTEALMISIDRLNELGSYGNGSLLMYTATPFWSGPINTPNGNKGTAWTPGIEIDLAAQIGRGVAQARSTWYNSQTIWQNSEGDLRHSPVNWYRMEDLVYNNPALKGKDSYYGKPLQKYSDDGVLLCADTIRCWFDWPHYKLFIEDPTYSPKRGGHTDYYIYRLAETYLLRAEAYFWKGEIEKSVLDINFVRNRAHAPLLGNNNVNIGTILDERARELYYEELRNTELSRIAYIFATSGKQAYNGNVYSLDEFSDKNFWYDRIMEKTDFYNQGVFTNYGNEYTMSSYHVLWPIPAPVINANTEGVINQNKGYTGYENNVPPLTEIK